MALLNYFPLTIWAGAGLLGWVAVDVIASDPIIANYAASFGAGTPAKIRLALSIIGTSAGRACDPHSSIVSVSE